MHSDQAPLKGFQRSFLFRKAHALKPIVMIGKQGLTGQVTQAVSEALNAHELIKVRFTDFLDERRELSESLARDTGALLVGLRGHVAVLYRRHPDPERRSFHVPGIHFQGE